VSALEERVDLIRVLNGKTERIAGTDADIVRSLSLHLVHFETNHEKGAACAAPFVYLNKDDQ
jgi:hypothetical protein